MPSNHDLSRAPPVSGILPFRVSHSTRIMHALNPGGPTTGTLPHTTPYGWLQPSSTRITPCPHSIVFNPTNIFYH